MGIAIYISKEALAKAGVEMVEVSRAYHQPCKCGNQEIGYCDSCGIKASNFKIDYIDIKELPFLMNEMEEFIYHDANSWGNSRKPILEFIKSNHIANDDWYEG